MIGINYTIKEHIATLSSHIDQNGIRWHMELNVISWNDREPVFDIREWREDYGDCNYGVKLDRAEMENLVAGYIRLKKEREAKHGRI